MNSHAAYMIDKSLLFYFPVAMEDLSHMHLLHDDLVKGNIDLDIAKQLGQMLGKLHKSTHRDNVSKEHWQKLGEKFG